MKNNYSVSDIMKNIHGTKYYVSESGKIFRKYAKGMKEVGGYVTTTGHLNVQIMSNGKRNFTTVEHLVASHFIPNPMGATKVHHKDGNLMNNSVDNLEWVKPLKQG